MAWQETYETGRIVAIAYADEETAVPTTLPDTGSSMDWTETSSGENCYGWTVNDFLISEDDFEFTDAEGNPVIVDPPTANKKVAILRDKADTPDQIRFTSYEVGAKVLAWATNITVATAKHTKSDTFTRKALIIEIGGLGLHYFPSVEIMVGTSGGGYKTLSTQTVTAEVFGTSTYPTGYEYHHYQDA